jgi:hypothetical protein
MKKTFVDVLLELPVDTTLQNFLADNGLPLPDELTWSDDPEVTKSVIEAIQLWSDQIARDKLVAKLMASVGLGDAAGKQAMFQVARQDGAALVGLAASRSDIHRSFWLYVNHPALFDLAGDVDYFERHGTQAQQNDLGVKRKPNTSDAALLCLRQAISEFYQRELQCGDGSVAFVLERSPDVYLLTVHVKDLAMLRLEFAGPKLTHHIGNPNIHMVLEYSAKTGVARSLVKGGAKYHSMLLTAFAEHLLGVKVDAHRIKPPTLDLSALRLGFNVPQALTTDGFMALQVKTLSLLSPHGDLKVECTATASSDQQCVTELLAEAFPSENPIKRNWQINSAHINLYYPPEPGKARSKVITIEITRKGRLNLHKFDAKLQAQLEGYLVSMGILDAGQTLSANEQHPGEDAHQSEPAYQD